MTPPIQSVALKLGVFISAATLMIFEILSARILAPYFGSDIYVWGNIIGVFLFGISLGNTLGGKIADHSCERGLPFFGVMLAGTWIALVPACTTALCLKLLSFEMPKPWDSLVASLLIFFVPVICLSMLTPSAAKQVALRSGKIGEGFGSVSGLAGMGSLLGIFLTTFVLLKSTLLGTSRILLFTGAFLFWAGLGFNLLFQRSKIRTNLATGAFGLLLVGFIQTAWITDFSIVQSDERLVERVETPNHVLEVLEKTMGTAPVASRRLRLAGSLDHALVALDENLTAQMDYIHGFALAWLLKPITRQVAILGAGGGLGAREMLRWFSQATTPRMHIDVVDIEPEMFHLAEKYFGYPVGDPRLASYPQDAREFLRKARVPYDFVVLDAFTHCNQTPEHLLSREFFQEVKAKLSSDGNFMINFLYSSNHAVLLASLVKTLQSVFPQVHIVPVNLNILLLASPTHRSPLDLAGFNSRFARKSPKAVLLAQHLQTAAPEKGDQAHLMTDDNNPVNLLNGCL